ncbi:hypothetical protein CPB86DRAFT_123856 [Serendipita vermifera]|nr:hypothetical protein CPB86DRAFT_123856 [Serendipita vermifera]
MAEAENKKKRKRNLTHEPRITYRTPLKTFERIFKESSLNETKHVVKQKLGLGEKTEIHLTQIRGTESIVLEDEDDFQALCVTLQSDPLVMVQVTIADQGQEDVENDIQGPPPKKKRTNPSEQSISQWATSTISHEKTAVSINDKGDLVPDPPLPLPDKGISSHSPSPKALLPTSFYTTATVAPIKRPIHSTSPSVEDIPRRTNGVTPERISSPENLSAQPAISKIKGDGNMSKRDSGKEKANHSKRKSGVDSIVPMSPAAMEKAAALLQRHRETVAENAIQRNKRRRKTGMQQKSTIKIGEELPEEHSTLGPNDPNPVKEKKKRKADVVPKQNTEVDKATSPSNEISNIGNNSIHQKSEGRPKDELEGSGTSKHAPASTAYLSLRRKLPAIHPDHGAPLDLISKDDNKVTAKKGREVSSKKSSTKGARGTEPSCPICDGPFHLRFRCPVVIAGNAESEDVLNDLKKGRGSALVKSFETKDSSQNQRKQQSAISRGMIEGNNIDDVKEHGTKVSEKSDSEEDSRSILSMPASVTGRPPRSSLVSLERPGEGSNLASSDDDDSSKDVREEEFGEGQSSFQTSRPSTPTANVSIHSIPPTSPSAASTRLTVNFPVLDFTKHAPTEPLEHPTTLRGQKKPQSQDTKLLARNSSDESSKEDETEPDDDGKEVQEPIKNPSTPGNINHFRENGGQTAPVHRQREAVNSSLTSTSFPNLNPKVYIFYRACS